MLGEEWEWHQSLHAPRDAAARRAHFERTEKFNAFHDGADSPEIRKAIDRARKKALAAIKARKPNDPDQRPGLQPKS